MQHKPQRSHSIKGLAIGTRSYRRIHICTQDRRCIPCMCESRLQNKVKCGNALELNRTYLDYKKPTQETKVRTLFFAIRDQDIRRLHHDHIALAHNSVFIKGVPQANSRVSSIVKSYEKKVTFGQKKHEKRLRTHKQLANLEVSPNTQLIIYCNLPNRHPFMIGPDTSQLPVCKTGPGRGESTARR